MTEYIDREAIVHRIKDMPTYWADSGGVYGRAMKYPEGMLYCEDVVNSIKNAPSAHVIPVRHAKWVDRYSGKYANQLYECSECKCRASYKFENDSLDIGLWVQDLTDYCPNCGARMNNA